MQSETIRSQEIVTKEEVAEIFRVDVRTVEQMMHDKALPFYKLGKRNPRSKRDRRAVRFNRAEVMAALSKWKQ